MIHSASKLAIALALSIGAAAQNVPQCQQTCQTAALSSTGCSAPSAPCGCDTPYQQAMLECLVKPSAQGGCTYDQIIAWQDTIQTQCFMSPPILPPCLTICPLQAEEAANCSSSADNGCICGTTYTTSATSCLQQACPDQFEDWNNGHLELCNAQSPSGSSSSGGGTGTTSPSSSTSRSTSGRTTGTATATPTTTTGASSSTSSPAGSGATKVEMRNGSLVVALIALSVVYALL
ncbi:hypothetical protein M408DRAFT_331524 [Serendipita vermifera MAFF 305830]|uniref:CFEM domain-containing protein n=1 Tax=Serendipita vermifera MAFF 305830 TaxID=933852 RepID=A0A0C2X6C6_SERVB|nr:hypothetical protein M408DRAFT_331524 [Serendipita vermifera MAFF 305830]